MKLSIALLLAGLALAQDLPNVEVETVVKGMHFAEGPAWSLEGFLLFSDTTTDQLKKFTPGKGVSDVASRAGGVNGNAYDDQGRFYTCEFRERRVTRTAKNGKVDVIASKFEGKRFNAPADIVVRHDGNAYFTDPAFGSQQDSRELDFYGVYHIKTNNEVEAVARWKTRPHGVALSPNGSLLYVSDADARTVHVFNIGSGGGASNDRILIDKIDGVPGGIRTDDKGNLYVAAKSVEIYSPKGELLRSVALSQTPSNLAFGDAGFTSLYVTARTSIYRLRMGAKGALPYAPQVP